MALHSSFPKGSNILIIFKNKNIKNLRTKFLDNKSGKIITEDGEFNKKEIRATTFYKDRKDVND